MKNTLTFLLLMMIFIGFGLQSCEKKNKKASNLDSPKSMKNDNVVNHKNLNENYDYQDFREFYEKLRESLMENSETVNFCSFPFNENISKDKFSLNEMITQEVKNIILKVYPEQSGEKYIIDNDSFYIQFEKNKSGFWKLKSIDRSY